MGSSKKHFERLTHGEPCAQVPGTWRYFFKLDFQAPSALAGWGTDSTVWGRLPICNRLPLCEQLIALVVVFPCGNRLGVGLKKNQPILLGLQLQAATAVGVALVTCTFRVHKA